MLITLLPHHDPGSSQADMEATAPASPGAFTCHMDSQMQTWISHTQHCWQVHAQGSPQSLSSFPLSRCTTLYSSTLGLSSLCLLYTALHERWCLMILMICHRVYYHLFWLTTWEWKGWAMWQFFLSLSTWHPTLSYSACSLRSNM